MRVGDQPNQETYLTVSNVNSTAKVRNIVFAGLYLGDKLVYDKLIIPFYRCINYVSYAT